MTAWPTRKQDQILISTPVGGFTCADIVISMICMHIHRHTLDVHGVDVLRQVLN